MGLYLLTYLCAIFGPDKWAHEPHLLVLLGLVSASRMIGHNRTG
jgi:hypothetical protein